MSAEDYPPNNKETNSEMDPASTTTKKALQDIIAEKTPGDFNDQGEVWTSVYFDTAAEGKIGLSRIKKGTSRDDPSRVARISRTDTLLNPLEPKITTNYFLQETPDGLNIEKDVFAPPNRLEFDPEEFAELSEYFGAAVLATYEEVVNQDEVKTIENEVGMSFVAEAEAQRLLTEIRESQPTPPADAP